MAVTAVAERPQLSCQLDSLSLTHPQDTACQVSIGKAFANLQDKKHLSCCCIAGVHVLFPAQMDRL